MPFKKPKTPPQFADLKVTLAQSNQTDNALYQTVQILIDRLEQFRTTVPDKADEEVAVGVVPLHAPTHGDGATDPVDVKNLAGYPGGTDKFLRSDKTFAPAVAGSGMNLDYLGNFVSGPVYNDGDIVIGSDNIAYMCVVDGTLTPPEPWPGVGIASAVGPPGPTGPPGPAGPAGVNAAVDATYWTVTPHATLVNERALSLLANGYVKSTAGEPSTVSIIPVSDGGTGANNASGARTNLGIGNVGTLNLSGDANTYLNGVGAWVTSPTGVPSGMIAIFTTACPAGWTRVTQWDGRYLRAAAIYGTLGGAYNHAHGAGSLTGGSHSHGPGSYAGPSHNHGSVNISGNTSSVGDHTHYFDKNFGGSTNAGNSSTMNVDAGGSGFMSRSDHIHSISGNVAGDTTAGGGHNHTFSGSGTPNNDGGQAISGTSAVANVPVTGSTDVQDHQPPFVDVIFCYKL